MRKWLILIWLLIPFLAFWFHQTHGKSLRILDKAASHVTAGMAAENDRNWELAEKEYQQALELLPAASSFQNERFQIELARQRTLVPRHGMLNAINTLQNMLAESNKNKGTREFTLNDIRAELAKLHYQASWLLRLQGAPQYIWMSEADKSRAEYACLARSAQASRNVQNSSINLHNTQAAVWLLRVDLSELRGLPLPDDSPKSSGKSQQSQPGDSNSNSAESKTQSDGDNDSQQDGQQKNNSQPGKSASNMTGNSDLADQFTNQSAQQQQGQGNQNDSGGVTNKSPDRNQPPGNGASGGGRTGKGS